MSTSKEDLREILDRLPDDATLEEIQYQLYVRQKVERGLQDESDGRVISHEELKQRMVKFRGPGNSRGICEPLSGHLSGP